MKEGYWYCTKCKAEVEPMHVTFWETHDERFGGCGCSLNNSKPDVLDVALAQRIGGADGELVEALCAEICRLRSKEVVAWMVEDGITIREDFAAMLGWTGATVGTGRAIPKSWSPMLYSPMMANAEVNGGRLADRPSEAV